MRGTGRSPRGEVTVEVDAAGALRDLQLTDGALQYRARDLEAMILEAVRVAQHDAAARAIAVAEDAWGEGDPAVEHLRAELQERQAAR
ncbi:YbaB/EbfC family nucleoid-associated protein [Cellulomonas bogoriensis]|uniref:YbaB/EbfC family nucleoid-associated protein n=1 Tax=Cellulomonas bogoriensis TaxID=301388 RepID=UPI0038B79332